MTQDKENDDNLDFIVPDNSNLEEELQKEENDSSNIFVQQDYVLRESHS